MPYTNPFGIVYDSGDYPAALDRVLALADWAGFEARRAEARRRGRCRGIELANYIEIATGAPREPAQVTARPDGFIDMVIGTLSAGQGHETAFAQLIAEWLGSSRTACASSRATPTGSRSAAARTPGAPCAWAGW